MKKFLGLALALASIGIAAPAAEAKAGAAAVSPAATAAQWRSPQWRNRNRRGRVVTQTRLVRRGRRVFRETYRVRYLPNGRTQTTLISRVRVS